MRHLTIIIIMFCSLNLLSQIDDTKSQFHVPAIQLKNPDLIALIDTILYMDSLCIPEKDMSYLIKIKDTIIDDIRRYFIIFIGCSDLIWDTTGIYGCLKYRNLNFLFKKNQAIGIGIHVSEDKYIIDINNEFIPIRDNIPTTYCLYSLGRLWIMDREWDWSKSCAKYNYPIEVLIVKRN